MSARRLSLTSRIFLSSAGIVAAVMLTTLALTQRSAQQAAATSIRRQLDATVQRVQEIVTAQRAQLADRIRAYADNPVYRASIDTKDYFDYADVAADQSGANWVQLVSREGVRLAKSDDQGAPPDTLTGSPLIRGALDGDISEGFGVLGDSILIQTVAVPIGGRDQRILGALMGVKYVGDSIARAVSAQTQSDVYFYVLDRDGTPTIAASTDALRRERAPLLASLAARLRTDSAMVEQAGASADTAARGDTLERIELNGEHFVSRRATLASVSGAPVGGFVAMRSLDRELGASGYTRLRNTLLFAGAGGLLFALLIAGLTARQVARPVTLLASATRRAAEGDYNAEIPEGGQDEIGTLSSAFRRLLADLKDKQALVDFLSVAAPAPTQVLSATATTVRSPVTPAGSAGAMVLQQGQTLGSRYEIKGVLGVGGMGMVYKANDRELGELVAIKTLKPEMVAAESTALERFKSEIKLARRISHRNVVRTYDLGETNGLYYLTMEYVEGKSLKELIRERGRLPASAVLPIAKQLCRALEIAHEEGVIHRDIKPQNMVVQGDGVLKVMDFGIARLASRPADGGYTQQGMIIGTPEYMAPEQLMGDDLDARADLYATGCVLYECLVGRVPLTAGTPMALVAKVMEETPTPPRLVMPDIPQPLSDLVMWSLAKDREKRPRSAAELHAKLDEIALG